MGVVQRRVLRGLWRRLVGVGIIGPGLLGAPAFILPLAALPPSSWSAAFALLERRVGDESNPPVAPSVAASKHTSARIETCFKDTATDINNA